MNICEINEQVNGKRKKERRKGGKKEVDGARADVGLVLVNLLSFHLLSSRKTIGTGSANIYCLLIAIIDSFLY